MKGCIAQGREVPERLVGPLRDSTDLLDSTILPNRADRQLLEQRVEDDGYVFLRGVVSREVVLAARREVFERLAEVGEIRQPAEEGIATGESRRRDVGDLGAFWQSVSEGPALRHVSHGPALHGLMEAVFGGEARPHDYMFLRPGVVGRSTRLHYDFPFFARGSNRIHTVWLALGDVPVNEGPLMVVEGSNRYADLIEPVQKIDYESKYSPTVQILGDTVQFIEERGSRLLTADFQAGDLVVFSMFCLHGSLDNHSPLGRVRLSCDVRWQPAADPIDERYFGPNPKGTTGAGYGELNGAKPLTEPWHTR
jgi:ectoine hydroxylase-related dioxygenase (phytanoyl-CoA dioxygenase family)